MTTTSIRASKHVFAIDCPDPHALAEFYAQLLGWEIHSSSQYPNWVDVFPPEGDATSLALGFQRVENYQRPTWPEGPIPQQAHLDFHVDSIEETTPLAQAAGATKHSHQPSADGAFVVFLDPAGHPFCLCKAI